MEKWMIGLGVFLFALLGVVFALSIYGSEGTMGDEELRALVALVESETALTNADVAKFGEPQCDPWKLNSTRQTLYLELERRGILPKEES